MATKKDIKGPLSPHASVLVKLGAAVVHAQELVETKFANAEFDIPAFKTVAYDPDVVEWIKQMGPLLPLKRSP